MSLCRLRVVSSSMEREDVSCSLTQDCYIQGATYSPSPADPAFTPEDRSTSVLGSGKCLFRVLKMDKRFSETGRC